MDRSALGRIFVFSIVAAGAGLLGANEAAALTSERSAIAASAPLAYPAAGLPARAASVSAAPDTLKPGARLPTARYWLFVANESSDLVSRVRFGPEGAALEDDIEVGIMPADLDGAHGVSVSPDGRHVYVSLAHGTPFGKLWSYRTADGVLTDSVTVGLFPATIGITPDGSLGFVVNFNLHGNPVPSSVSAVFLPEMVEVARIETCIKPHGSRVNHAGTLHYSVCAGDDHLVEISVERLEISRIVKLTPGSERVLAGPGEAAAPGGGADTPVCGPSWVVPSFDDRRVYVTCNRNGQVLELDAATLSVTRRFRTGKGPYNLAVSSDGRLLLATNKGDQSVSVFDLASGEELARVPTTRPITHGVVVSPDNRYAFVSNEAVGATRGTVDVIDLDSLEIVASTELHHQPGGIDLWRSEPLP
ncbi:MAG: YncE family protein [Gemmatimonadota bacterium]|jgi:YVTN family beta-propeller protein|nr:MAG: YncE family protein [Gemmatimonadota bacterium]